MTVSIHGVGYMRSYFIKVQETQGRYTRSPAEFTQWVQKQGGVYVRASARPEYKSRIEFENEADATMFVLKWRV